MACSGSVFCSNLYALLTICIQSCQGNVWGIAREHNGFLLAKLAREWRYAVLDAMQGQGPGQRCTQYLYRGLVEDQVKVTAWDVMNL